MKIRNSMVHAVVQAVNRLDPPVGTSAFKLSGKVRFAMAKSLRKLQEELETLEEVRQKLIESHGLKRVPQTDGSVRLEGERLLDYEKAFQAVLDEEVEVELHQIDEAELDLENNAIPVTTLAVLVGTVVRG